MAFQNLSLDIRSFIQTAAFLALAFALIGAFRSIRLMRSQDSLPYFRLRQQQLSRAWRSLFLSLLMLILGMWLLLSGENAAYKIFPVTLTPSPTVSPTVSPSPTLSPSITLTPSQTATLQYTYTPSPTPIPVLPQSIIGRFQSSVTPNPNTSFSPLIFSRGLDLESYETIGEGTLFANPVNQIFASFSYDQMLEGVQWTALWFRRGEQVNYETKAWDGGTDGLGYAEWAADAEEWLPGNYQVQLFVGQQIVVVGDFQVEGEALTSTPAPTWTASTTPTFTLTNTPTITLTHTRFPTDTSSP